ncbi:acetyltransferase [Bacteroidota bacterium]
MKKIIIIGGMGNGTVALSTIEDVNQFTPQWEILGFLNDFETDDINGYPVIGKLDPESAAKYLKFKDVFFLYTLISTKLNHKFIHKLYDLHIPLEKFANIIHPTAVISKFARLGYGISIQPFVSVGPNVTIGNHVQIYAQSLIGHNSTLDDYSYVANNACIGACVHLKPGAYLGTNCSILENVTIGEWSLIGIGSVIIKDVEDFSKVVGNPSKIIGSTK